MRHHYGKTSARIPPGYRGSVQSSCASAFTGTGEESGSHVGCVAGAVCKRCRILKQC